jgi:hypothetical protein
MKGMSASLWLLALALCALGGRTGAAEEDAVRPAAVSTNDAAPAAGAGRLDRFHDWAYHVAHDSVTRLDSWFVPKGEAGRDMPPSKFRVGLIGDLKWRPEEDLAAEPVVEADAEVKLPNAEERLRVFITTLDPTELPGRDLTRRRSQWRIGLGREWFDNVDTSAGVKLQWLPVAYGKISWGPLWRLGAVNLYPYQKAYWESDEGIGEVTSFVADYWQGGWDFRSSSAAKWSEKRARDDRKDENEPRGWEWSQGFMAAYACELIDQRDRGRLAGGDDLARGGGVRLLLEGNPEHTDRIRTTLFYKLPLYRGWIYTFAAPEVIWERESGWVPGYGVKVGVDILFWGTSER